MNSPAPGSRTHTNRPARGGRQAPRSVPVRAVTDDLTPARQARPGDTIAVARELAEETA